MKATLKLLCVLFIISENICFAQQNAGNSYEKASSKPYPVIGQRCPDFTLTDVENSVGKQLSLNDLKGKHVILDFWAESCISCVQGFPHVSKLQEKFRDSLTIVLVGLDSRNIRAMYNRLNAKHHLNLISAYDTILHSPPFKPIGGVPWYIWINDQGVVNAVTPADAVTEENIQQFIAGKAFSYRDESYDAVTSRRETYTMETPFLVNGNGGTTDTDFLYRSVLTRWKPGMAIYDPETIEVGLGYGKRRYEALGVKLAALLETAYLEKRMKDSIYRMPIMEAKDSARFTWDAEERYCYSLSVPETSATEEHVRRLMQSDLKNYFKVEAAIEEREMPCLLLTIINSKKFNRIKSNNGTQPAKEIERGYGLELVNMNIAAASDILKYHWGKYDLMKLYNETGYSGNINLKVDALITDFEEVKKVLNANGLDVVPSRRKIKVFVIKDVKS